MKTQWSAMILTGGSSSRFGSDKSHAMLGGNSLIDTLLATLPSEIKIVIVGPELQPASRSAKYTREDPIGGGPVAAIHAGLDLIETEFVAVIATDMPFASLILDVLTVNFPTYEDATIPLDSHKVRQTLCAIYRAEALREAISKLGSPQGQSMRQLTQLLSVKEFPLDPAQERILVDIDTPSDLQQAINLAAGEEESVGTMDKWIEAVQKELGTNVEVNQELILNLARDAAHGVERKAAPITTFLLGIAIAGGADPEKASKGLAELAGNWPVDK